MILKISKNTKFTTQPKKGEVEVGSDDKARRDGRCKLGGNEVDDGESKDDEVGKKD